jgi:hypothetical protein
MTQYFAEVDGNNIVTQVIVAGQSFVDSLGGKWIETTMDGSIRKNYAGIGYTYDSAKDAFYAPQPFPSWTLDDACHWQAPTPYPTDGVMYTWNEDKKDWEAIVNG